MKFAKTLICFCFVLCLAGVCFSADFTVSKTADTNDGVCDADCSLREAIGAANAAAGNDTIYFSMPLFASPQTITLSGTEIVIANNGSLTVHGSGANRLTISGNNASRIISISDDAVVNIHHVRFTGGTGVGAANTGRGGAVYNNGGTTVITNTVFTANTGANGGAMNNATAGTLTIIDSVMIGNMATTVGGAMQNFSTSTLNLINTSITGNSCGTSSTGGGAIQGNGMITMTNVTMSGNTSQASGGGIYYNGTGLTMTNTTITGNTAATNAGGFHKSTATNNANIRNSIISGNTGGASPDITNVINSLGNNVIGMVGTSTGWVGSDLQNQNPLLSPLGFHGGNGYTHALLTSSPAINAGQDCVKDLSCAANNPPVAVSADERGASRADTVDIGAYEVSSDYRATLPCALLNQSYSSILTPNIGAFTYSNSGGSLPPGVGVFTGAITATVNGTPTATGAFDFAVTLTNGVNPATVNYQLNVLTDLSIVPVTGRVTNSAGIGLGKISVSLEDQNGNTRSTVTNPFGFFFFDDLAAGRTYTLSASSKQYTFNARTITVADANRSMDLVATP